VNCAGLVRFTPVARPARTRWTRSGASTSPAWRGC
jgi:hypothetical protein